MAGVMTFVPGINLFPAGHQQITALSAAVGLTPPTKDANVARVQAETQNVRVRDDGTDPAAGVGELLYAGDQPTWLIGDLNKYRFLEATASAKLNVTFYKAVA